MTSPLPDPSAALRGFERTLRSVGRRFRLHEADYDELVQEVRVRLWRAEERESGSTATASYVWKTATAAAIDLFRRRRTRGTQADRLAVNAEEFATTAVPGPERDLEQQELLTAVHSAISELSETRRVPVRMHLAGYSRDEIASAMGWTEPKTRNLIYRGLADLRSALLARGIGWEGDR